jgi:hypothetical protein
VKTVSSCDNLKRGEIPPPNVFRRHFAEPYRSFLCVDGRTVRSRNEDMHVTGPQAPNGIEGLVDSVHVFEGLEEANTVEAPALAGLLGQINKRASQCLEAGRPQSLEGTLIVFERGHQKTFANGGLA